MGYCVGGPLDGQIKIVGDPLSVYFEALVAVEAEVTTPTPLELHDPLVAMEERMRLDRVRYEWRGGKWVYAPSSETRIKVPG
jgi:hypothetical protein